MVLRLAKYPIFVFLFGLAFFLAKGELLRPTEKDLLRTSIGSAANDPELIGPDRLCNIVGSVVGIFSGGGDSATDVYKWTILAPDGSVLFTRPPGAFQKIEYTFEQLGVHKVKLEVSRGNQPPSKFEKEVLIIKGPTFALSSSYKICAGQSIELQAISPASTNFSSYVFNWTNEAGELIGSSNLLSVNIPGKYDVEFYIPDNNSNPICLNRLATSVEILDAVEIVQSSGSVCKDGNITFQTNPPTKGQWFLTSPGETNPVWLGDSVDVTLTPDIDILNFGEYKLELIIENAENPACSPKASTVFTYQEEPRISFSSSLGATGCFNPDGGLELIAETNLDLISVGGVGSSYGPFTAGDIITIPNLESGAYTLYAYLNGCQNTLGAVVPLDDSPTVLAFTIENIESESCTTSGKTNGSFEVNLTNGATYRVLSEKGDVITKQALPTINPFTIDLGGGNYFFEILDKDSCNLPNRKIIEIPGKSQTNFNIPELLTICGSYDLIPETTEPLLFTLTDPSGNSSSKLAGEPFTITEAGEYSLIGILPDQSEICPSQLKLTVSTTDPIPFDPILKSEDCVIGNRVYEAEIYGTDPNTANFLWRNSEGDTIGTGQNLFLSPTSIGTFSLEVQPKDSELCPITPKEFLVKAPVLFVDATINSTKLCEFGPEAIVELTTTSPEAVTDIRWRRFNESGEIEELFEFNNQKTITTRIGGTYEASAYSIIPAIQKDCELGRVTFQLDLTPDKVVFDIPEQLTICDFYELLPETTQDLQFFLTTPSGEVVEKPSGQTFTLDEAGTYTFLAFDSNSPSVYCPEQKELVVILSDAVDFEPVISEEFCDGSITYQAIVTNYSIEDVDISWKDKDGNQIGTEEFLTLREPGNYSLEVQPSNVIPCHIEPKSFDVLPPVLELDVQLVAEPLCPDSPSASIVVETDFTTVESIEWWYTTPSGEQSELTAERNRQEILATNEGTYEVRVFNAIPCLLGSDKTLILRSTDTVRPQVEESYQICPKYEIAPTINPGSFASYEWYFGDQLVSTSPVYKPNLIGDYNLIVYSQEGCAYQTSFVTEEECELKVIYPNAVQPGNPEKEFLLYTNYLIDELDLVIMNKWGQVVFQCSKTNLISEESTCAWDGTYDGNAIPNGTYAVRLNFKNYEKNITKTEFGSILIIE